ncbi:surf-like protein [Coelomomyces lativittatus]|nr:surf-like protein [Coelomomyces lativittatus]
MAFSLTPLYTPLVVFPITTCLLGIWQLYRLKWKLNLLHQSEVALASPPLSLDSHFETIPVLTRVVASGHLDPPPPFLVGPRTFQGEPGYNVIYPFTLTNGKRILVNLGWIQKSMRNKYLHSVPNASLYLNVEGMLYPVHALRPLIKLRNDPERNEWVWCDVDRMSQLANTHPMFMQVQATRMWIYPSLTMNSL